MQGGGIRLNHRLRALSAIATVMQNNCEVIVLQRIHDLLDIHRRISLAIFIRQKAGSRFGNHHACHTDPFQFPAIRQDKGGALFQQLTDRVGLDVDRHHNFRHIV